MDENVSMSTEYPHAECDYCGTQSSGLDWLRVEIFREDPAGRPGDGDYLNLWFCAPTHAGRYFTERPLDFSRDDPLKRGWGDRLASSGFALGVGSVMFFTLVGVWTLIGWLRS